MIHRSAIIFVVLLACTGSSSCLQPKPMASLPGAKVQRSPPKAAGVIARHKEELYRLPGVTSIAMKGNAVHVYTSIPTAVPTELEKVPVKVFPPWGGTSLSDESSVGSVLLRHGEGLQRLPGVRGIHGKKATIDIYTDNPSVVPEVVEGIPVRIVSPQANPSL